MKTMSIFVKLTWEYPEANGRKMSGPRGMINAMSLRAPSAVAYARAHALTRERKQMRGKMKMKMKNSVDLMCSLNV